MKVKRLWEDFVVREISHFEIVAPQNRHAAEASEPSKRPQFSVYLLDKRGLGTPEAVNEILSLWNLQRQQISTGGMKDRHAVTSQKLTIFRGPPESIERPGFQLSYLGASTKPFTAADIVANQFDIVLRGLSVRQADAINQASQQDAFAAPNYFDEQRFGSLGASGQFVALPWCLADYEKALFLAIAEPNVHDRPDDREQKEILRDHWGNWQVCKDRLERSHRRSIVTYLVDHPTGFKKAVALIRKDLRSIYVAAFQSKLWNELISRYLSHHLPPEDLLRLPSKAGTWVFPARLDRDSFVSLSEMRVPLPSGRETRWPAEFRGILNTLCAEIGIEPHKLRFSHPRDVFFSRGERDVLLRPDQMSIEQAEDELSSGGENKLRLRFQLLPGQYATMVIKALELLAEHRAG